MICVDWKDIVVFWYQIDHCWREGQLCHGYISVADLEFPVGGDNNLMAYSHYTGTGIGAVQGTGLTSVNISTWYYTFHLVPVQKSRCLLVQCEYTIRDPNLFTKISENCMEWKKLGSWRSDGGSCALKNVVQNIHKPHLRCHKLFPLISGFR